MDRGNDAGTRAPSIYLDPELLVERAGDQAALEQNHHALRRPVLQLEVQVLSPVVELGLLQGFDVEVRTLDLQSKTNVRQMCEFVKGIRRFPCNRSLPAKEQNRFFVLNFSVHKLGLLLKLLKCFC